MSLRIAFLGPVGTHSERSLKEFLPTALPVPCFSISDTFRALLETRVDALFVPVENMIQGPVTETLDLLFEYHSQVCITNSYLAKIENALGVLPENLCGKPWPRTIQKIVSHDQPLRQCSKYLAHHFQDADRIAASSTAAGIQQVKDSRSPDSAVIGSRTALEFEGFEIVANDISDVAGNKTRFLLVERGDIDKTLSEPEALDFASTGFVTSLVMDPGRDRQGLLFEILQVMSVRHGVNLLAIHSRPDTKGGVVFYFDLEGHPRSEKIHSCLLELKRFCSEATGKTAQIHILGAYPRTPFYEIPFATVGIIGSAGTMGGWFRKFFAEAGIRVFECDKSEGLSIEEVARNSDVILLSVPMSAVNEVVKRLLPCLRPSQLVVENCSVKSCILPYLLGEAPSGVEILGIHTMFSGDIASLVDENVIITRTARSGERAQAFEDLLYKYGATIRYANIERHDLSAAFVQSTLQLAMLILADVMEHAFTGRDEFEFMSTPNFRNVSQTISRVLNQTDKLLLDLQTQNIFAEKMRHQFLESAFRIIFALDQKDEKKFFQAIQNARAFIEKGNIPS